MCVIVAGVLRATLPGPEFSVAWTHSVEKVRWEEHYRLEGGALVLAEARVQGSGAGMEPAGDAEFRGGWWTWRPHRLLDEVRLATSPYAGDYTICRGGRCAELAALIGPTPSGAVTVLRPCIGE